MPEFPARWSKCEGLIAQIWNRIIKQVNKVMEQVEESIVQIENEAAWKEAEVPASYDE